MKRGDLVTVAMKGDYGKPRPALVIQSDHFAEHSSISILPITGMLVDAPLLRITLEPSVENGLHKASQVMMDKITTIRHDNAGEVFGEVAAESLQAVERSLAVFLGIAK